MNFAIGFAWFRLCLWAVLWPVSAFTWAKEEPQTVLALSFIALIESAAAVLMASKAERQAKGK